ncbi:hypothetical protein [Flavobacterium sp. M31R6]|nr:hypothetical protein [Flavobacterium sp. M31R6]QKJ62293.1 hypothetical protein HQN62_03790 [Flavobacterium sp. M31R6]
MQPSAVERLDFERRQTGASIGSQSHPKMLFSKNQFCGLGVKLMQPSAVE